MKRCPIFAGAVEGWCLRERCRYFDSRKEKCVYEAYSEKKKRATQRDIERIRKAYSRGLRV